MKNKVVVISGVALFILLGFVGFCRASDVTPIFSDNFNSYTQGPLIGQGDWTGNAGGAFVVNNTDCLEGLCIKKGSNFSGAIYAAKTGVNQTSMTMTFYFKLGRSNCTSNCRYNGLPFVALGLQSAPYWYGFFEDSSGRVTDVYGNILGTMGDNIWTKFVVVTSYYDGSVKASVYIGDQSTIGWQDTQLSYINTISFLDGNIDFNQWRADFIGYGENSTPLTNTKTPVLIVPGLTGTEMKNGSEKLWLDLSHNFIDIGDEFMDPLKFKSDIMPSNINLSTGNVISKEVANFGVGKILIFDYTFGLIQESKNQGYIENQNLFTFPYDWRYGVSGKYSDGKTNTDLLAQKIQDIVTQTGNNKVDIIAHSMGGLIVKKYVISHPADNHIRKAVFVGVPNTGAPESIKVLLQGDNFGIPWLSESEIKKISANLPAAYDLLPSQKYYDAKGSFVKIFDDGSLMDPNDQTVKDLNYSEFGDFLTNDHNLNAQALSGAGNLHTTAFDDFDLRTAGVDLYAIDGCKAGTIGKIIEHRFTNIFGQHFTEYKAPKFTPGDGTVPLESATNLPIDQTHKFYSLKGEHSKMMSQNGSRQQIVNVISGSNLEIGPNLITQDIERCELNGKAISIFSPTDILVADQNGNRLGNTDNGSILSEIPNADFEVFGSHKFLYLPTGEGQMYSIKIKGTGTGTYTINSQNIANNQVTGTEVFSNLPVTNQLTGQINLGLQTTLTIKSNSNSQPETILPSSVINANQSEDVVSPISTVILSGIVGQPGFYRSDVGVHIQAQDQIIIGHENQTSGVLSVNYNIDNTGYQKAAGNLASVNILNEGSHIVTFFAIDNAGNKGQEQTIQFTIDKTAPEAVVEFDPATKDLKFSAKNDPNTTITDKDDVITLVDQAGNITEITLKDKDRKKSMSAEIKSLKYNGVAADISKNMMKYKWSLDKNQNLKELFQRVKSKKDYNILAIFDGENTNITGKDASGLILNSFSGLKIIKISTNRGDFNWSY